MMHLSEHILSLVEQNELGSFTVDFLTLSYYLRALYYDDNVSSHQQGYYAIMQHAFRSLHLVLIELNAPILYIYSCFSIHGASACHVSCHAFLSLSDTDNFAQKQKGKKVTLYCCCTRTGFCNMPYMIHENKMGLLEK